jgi:hypothetical protein
MKCIHCGGDTKYVERKTTNRCVHCGHPFAFEPKSGSTYGIADGFFHKAIDDLSGGDKLHFTERQLYYEFNRRMLRRKFWRGPWGWVTGLSVAGGIAVAVPMFALGPIGLVPLIMGGAGAAYGSMQNKRAKEEQADEPAVSWNEFQSTYLGTWLRVHGRPEKMIKPPNREPLPSRQTTAPDLSAYSFDRALVVQHADLAAMLVANNFHFENNCAILSVDGYPFGRAREIMEMLRRNPNLKVFALHDASEAGCRLSRTLRGTDWFPDLSIPVIDLGLRPKHAQDLKLIVRRGDRTTLSNELKGFLALPEITWLESGNSAELAAMRPAKLMRSVYQGFAQANRAETTTGVDTGPDVIIWTDTPYVYSGGAEVYATDSFG